MGKLPKSAHYEAEVADGARAEKTRHIGTFCFVAGFMNEYFGP